MLWFKSALEVETLVKVRVRVILYSTLESKSVRVKLVIWSARGSETEMLESAQH